MDKYGVLSVRCRVSIVKVGHFLEIRFLENLQNHLRVLNLKLIPF